MIADVDNHNACLSHIQYRTSSWTKLPQLWYITKRYGVHYDYIWFFDSDAAINPKFFSRSLSDAMKDWTNHNDVTPSSSKYDPKDKSMWWGPKSINDASFIFFNNFPWRQDLPCAGLFLFKPKSSEALLREWSVFDI
jgi:hypothetical protein